jgi:hypothetical protein
LRLNSSGAAFRILLAIAGYFVWVLLDNLFVLGPDFIRHLFENPPPFWVDEPLRVLKSPAAIHVSQLFLIPCIVGLVAAALSRTHELSICVSILAVRLMLPVIGHLLAHRGPGTYGETIAVLALNGAAVCTAGFIVQFRRTRSWGYHRSEPAS